IIDIDSNSALWSDCNFLKHIRQNNRKFNIDKSPKVLFSKGPIIDLIIHSGAGPALEFQLISDSFIYYNDNIEKVPKSKEDVFQDDSISLIDKRRLMKFFNFVLEFDPSGETKNQLFWDHLISLKINPKLATIIISSIALKLNVSDLQTISLKTGIEAMKQHLNSFGRFGSGALLTANYGTGSELCQAFCRYCAVYGGEYILDLDLKSIKINSENVVVSDGSTTYTAKSIIIGANFAGILENVQINESKIHRLVCISDKPFLNDGEHVMLIIPAQCSQVDPSLDNKSEKDGAVAIQYNSNNQSCPEDTCKSQHFYSICRYTRVVVQG
ncbi:GDP dissociation inhibitor-domain-containing protein, partial [Globomyces pollinis-pini]